MFDKKPKKLTNLAKDDFGELIRRTELINQYLLIAKALELQQRLWLNDCLKKLGLSSDKQYEIDFKDGAIREKSNEPKKN